MNYVVLVKQVPDTKHIPKDAWDWESGTLRRALLENVCNDLDKQAMAFALKLREKRPGKLIALTMGPPFAAEVLRYALSLGADEGVLLTDRRLGGADTPATAYPLAQAMRKIEREIFGHDSDYLIITGMQSVDGDTAQVPPQVAEELGIDHIAYATGFEIDESGLVNVERVTRNGKETVAIERYPSLVTLTQWCLPPYPTFQVTRWAFQQKLHQWDADTVETEKSRIGLAGSHTSVVKIFPAREATTRRCQMASDVKELVELIRENYGADPVSSSSSEEPGYQLPEDKEREYRGDLWIYAEQEGGRLHPASFELLGKARELAGQLGEKVGAVLAGKGVDNLAPELIAHGADKVFVVDDELLEDFIAVPYTRAVVQLVDEHNPQMLMFSATPLGRELAPRIAYATTSGLTADCTDLRLGDIKRGSKERIGILVQTRPALGGNIMASIVSQNSRLQMSTARPGVLKALPPDPSRKGDIIVFKPDLKKVNPGVRVVAREMVPAGSGISGASIVIAGGIGCRTKETFDQWTNQLAGEFGRIFGETAMIGASRQAVEAGLIDRGHQVGQTGQTISPDLYVALGISGAVQHMSGVQDAGIVVAINKDPNAPIFRTCDFGLAGNLETVVPEMLRILNSVKPEGNS